MLISFYADFIEAKFLFGSEKLGKDGKVLSLIIRIAYIAL